MKHSLIKNACFVSILISIALPLISIAQAPLIRSEENGGFVNHQIEGNLKPSQTIGCVDLNEINNTVTPPDLYRAVLDCTTHEKYDSAIQLFMLAGIYSNFDKQRLTDKTAGQGRTVLIMNMFDQMTTNQKEKLNESSQKITANPLLLGKLCQNVRKIGAPNYFPKYMLLHGMKAFTGNPYENALVQDFDSAKEWSNLQTTYLHCPAK